MHDSRIAYVSFDRVPAPKGASVHILAFAQGLARAFGPLDLVTLGPPGTAGASKDAAGGAACGACTPAEPGEGIRHHALPATGDTLIERVLHFRAELACWWGRRKIPVVHFRSIYEGYPIACRKGQVCERIVFEVNGLPSIELKYHYPAVADDGELRRKLAVQEDRCLSAADLIVTPSLVTAEHLRSRGADPGRIRVIPNGVDSLIFSYSAPIALEGREVRLLYWGTMAAWQGVLAAIEALALCRRDSPARLTLVGPANSAQRKAIEDLCEKLGVSGHVDRVGAVSQEELCRIAHEHDVALAPLLRNDRNRTQGCCPLKVLEAMAAGIPLIASDLPVVSDLAQDGMHALLTKPGSAKGIKDAVLRLRGDPALGPRLSAAARRRVEEQFMWEKAEEDLVRAYEEELGLTARR